MAKTKKDKKVYVIYVSDDSSHLLGNITKTRLKGKEFIKGISLSDNYWAKNKNVYISPNEITGMIEFDSMEDYLFSKKIYDKNKKSKARKKKK
ncbi:MAG: hypothetical protein ABH873_06365 [Candidatus Firestonebacteria bacterium]